MKKNLVINSNLSNVCGLTHSLDVKLESHLLEMNSPYQKYEIHLKNERWNRIISYCQSCSFWFWWWELFWNNSYNECRHDRRHQKCLRDNFHGHQFRRVYRYLKCVLDAKLSAQSFDCNLPVTIIHSVDNFLSSIFNQESI